MWPFSSRPTVPVLRFSGPIGRATPLRSGLSIAAAAGAIERAFSASRLDAVAVVINSPGGSPVQSNLIFRRMRQLAGEKKKKVYVFCEDVAASGGYFLAIAGDEIYADPSSVVGSIGVISASFGLNRVIERLGIDYRLHTAGRNKSILDPFLPEKPEDVARLQALQREVHEVFIAAVRERRGDRLRAPDDELFSGAFWTGGQAVELGLIDGLADVRTKMRELYGEDVRLKPIPLGGGGLIARLRRLPSIAGGPGGEERAPSWADDLVSTLEARALWSRFGL